MEAAPEIAKQVAKRHALSTRIWHWLNAFVVTILLIAFGAFLWHISHRPGAEAAAEQAKAAVVTPEPLDELPPKPAKEPYTYIKELQTKEIQVEADQLATKAPANMFCGTFKAMDGAQQLKAKMAFAGDLVAQCGGINSSAGLLKGMVLANQRQQLRPRHDQVHLVQEHRLARASLAQIQAKVLLLHEAIVRRSAGVQAARAREF